MSSFDALCQRLAAELKQANPSGINPFVEKVGRLSKPGPCVDCGRITRNDYICDQCARGHVAPVRSPAA